MKRSDVTSGWVMSFALACLFGFSGCIGHPDDVGTSEEELLRSVQASVSHGPSTGRAQLPRDCNEEYGVCLRLCDIYHGGWAPLRGSEGEEGCYESCTDAYDVCNGPPPECFLAPGGGCAP